MSKKDDLIAEAKAINEKLEALPTPDGDHEGDSINEFVHKLTPAQGTTFDECVESIQSMVRDSAGDPDNRNIRILREAGFDVDLNPSQEDPMVIVGTWKLDDGRTVDLSDPSDEPQ